MEIGSSNLFSEHEIEEVIREHPDDGWDLLQQGRIKPRTLEVVPEEAEADPNQAKSRDIGMIAAKGADIHRQIAA